jgi:hydrogenase maturation protein HypF
LNDGEGVLIRARGTEQRVAALLERIEAEPPPLAQIEAIEIGAFADALPAGFHIASSRLGAARTQVSPDAALCPACAAEVLNPGERRYRYPFTNCTHCGPRLTIVEGIPYDRAQTTMRASRCATHASPNTAIPPTAAFMLRPSPARHAGHERFCAGSTAACPAK